MARVFIPAKSAEDWKDFLADPEKQWRTGYSARTLAYCWQEADGFPESVRDVFAASGIEALKEIECLLAIPERKVPLPGGGAASQNDIWVLARSEAGLISIAVEGKVSEPFGPTLGEWLIDASDGKKERLAYLKEQLGLTGPVPDNVRYQLLHRAASAVIEARRFNAAHAMMLVHSFSQSDEWLGDYERFVSVFGGKATKNSVTEIGPVGNLQIYCGWVRGEERFLES